MSIKEQAWAWVDASHEEMLQLWQELVNVDCGSGNKQGVDAVADKLEGILKSLGFTARQVHFAEAGNMLIGEWGNMQQPFVILTGHMDTVFADGTAAQRPFTIKEGKAYGPGVLDMKGGIVIFLSALQALLKNGYAGMPIKVILAGDEEVGHAHSDAAKIFMEESKSAVAAFNFETGFLDNGLVVERKGTWQFTMEVFGRGAHVGNDPENGRSAIKEIAHKLLDLEALTDWSRGINVNVGVISGGTVANAAPAYAKIICDVRFGDTSCLPEIQAQVEAIAAKQYVPDTKTVLSNRVTFLNMQKLLGTGSLFALVKEAAAECGLPEPVPKAVGGGSDSAYITAAGVPTICAMGVQGARNHTAEEFAVVNSLFERTKLFIAVLLKLQQH